MTDNINQPAHYTAGGIETIDVIEQVFNKVDHRDQVEKYNQRAHLKGTFKQDLEKARWYLNRTIENCEKGLLDPETGARVEKTTEETETVDRKFDTATVHKDSWGDYWVFNDSTQEWRWFNLTDDLSEVRYHGGTFTKEELESFFTAGVLYPVSLMRTERLVREAVEKFDRPIPEGIVIGETYPTDMPDGTTVYRDGLYTSYSVTKKDGAWYLSHSPEIPAPNWLVASWFKDEQGWTLEEPSDVYKDVDDDYWVDTGDGWRWHNICNGKLMYRSNRSYEFEDIDNTYSLVKLDDKDALRIRRIIRGGVK